MLCYNDIHGSTSDVMVIVIRNGLGGWMCLHFTLWKCPWGKAGIPSSPTSHGKILQPAECSSFVGRQTNVREGKTLNSRARVCAAVQHCLQSCSDNIDAKLYSTLPFL